MPRNRDETPAVRVYTVCDESRYLIVRNVPALGCVDELRKLFESYGPVEDCKPMDAEECEPFTDVYWIKFQLVNNSRIAKRKLDDTVFLGNKINVSYAPQFESIFDTRGKLEARRKEVLSRLKSREAESSEHSCAESPHSSNLQIQSKDAPFLVTRSSKERVYVNFAQASLVQDHPFNHVSSNKDYFPSSSMNETVRVVREKLDKISSSSDLSGTGSVVQKKRRRI